MDKTAIIVQARMGSSRLPGKVMKQLAGKTVLGHVLERCQSVAGMAAVCCATTQRPDDDVVAEEARRSGAEVFRGSETDVLARYFEAAKWLHADIIVRITGDCPLIDPEVVGKVIALRAQTDADYACNNMPPSWPHGLDCEAFPFVWLDRAQREAKRPSDREHVTPFIRNHPDATRVNLPCPIAGCEANRWTLDREDDLRFMNAMFERLPRDAAGFRWRQALAIVESDPAVASLNAGHDRLEGMRRSWAEDAAAGFAPRDG